MRTIKNIVKYSIGFVISNWKTAIKTVIAVYLLTLGIALLAGTGGATGLPLPTIAMTMPSITTA